jgi:hypothetical protein
MNGVGLFFLLLLLLLIIPAVGWISYTRYRAHRAGLPPPPLSSYNPFRAAHPISNYPVAPAPSGPLAWIQDKFHSIRNARGGSGYTGASARSGRRGNFDPDGAWDDRVGNEADAYGPVGGYEEQELGPHAPTAYGGSGYGGGAVPEYGEERGRSRSRDEGRVGGGQAGLDARYEADAERGTNPFGDEAEVGREQLRGVSPRPMEAEGSLMGSKGSPTERKSVFRESM